MGKKSQAVELLPPEIWNGVDFTCVHCAIIHASLENAALLASTLRANEYQRLLNAFQRAMLNLIWELEDQDMYVEEYLVTGDEVRICIYDTEEVVRNYKLDGLDPVRGREREAIIAEGRKMNQVITSAGLKTAIMLKNKWLAQNANLTRVHNRQPPHGLRIGLHTGRVHYCNRADQKRRVEGYAINIAKHIETAAADGLYSRIFVSQDACDRIRGSILGHTMLRQRIFFHEHALKQVMPEDYEKLRTAQELKFYSRVGISPSPEAIKQYETLITFEPKNIWAYYQLFEYYAYTAKDWDRVAALAKKAMLLFPHDEKVLLDLSRYYYQAGRLDQAQRFADRALELNPEFDLVYEHLAILAHTRDDTATQIACLSRALSLAPDSPVNNLNLGWALCENYQLEDGGFHIIEAIKGFNEYLEYPGFAEKIQELEERELLPVELKEYLAELGFTPERKDGQ